MDYVHQDGKKVQSTRLPGFSGAFGLDVDPEVLDLLDEADPDVNSTGDVELVSLLPASFQPVLA